MHADSAPKSGFHVGHHRRGAGDGERQSTMRWAVYMTFLASLLLGCSTQPPFIGKWQRHAVSMVHPEGYTEVLELSPCGELTLSPPPVEDLSETGHFEVLDRERIRLKFYGVTGICTARVDRAELRFTDPTGRTSVYERAN